MTDLPAPRRPAVRAAPTGRRAALYTAGIGFGAGLLNGLLGIGGGILIVPGLIFLRHASPRQAVSTSLGAVLCLSSVTLAIHLAISGLYFSLTGTALLLIAGVAGSQLGSYLLTRLPQRWILYLFAGFTFVASTNLILQGIGIYAGAGSPVASPPLWSFPAVGAVTGLFSGMLGVGGGGIVVLVFSAIFHTPILGGLPLALTVNVVNALSGILAQRGTGLTRWADVITLVPTALVGISAGVGLAVVMPANILRITFAVFFLYMGSRLLARGRHS